MKKLYAFGEKALYGLWESGLLNNILTTQNGDRIIVLDYGSHDHDLDGPDYKNAKLQIGGLTFNGDIEIDTNYQDWITHGHNCDPKYNSVILHLFLNNKGRSYFVSNKEGRSIDSVCLADYITQKDLDRFNLNQEDYSNYVASIKCHRKNIKVEEKLKSDFVKELGIIRFQKKCDRIYNRLKELAFLKELHLKEPVTGYDLSESFHKREFAYTDFQSHDLWNQLFYELLFEALGYGKNKQIMLSLSQEVTLSFIGQIKGENDSSFVILSLLLMVAGLIPKDDEIHSDDSMEYIRRIRNDWDNLTEKYDGRMFNETDWQFFRSRPHNFPTIRLAGGAVIVQRLLYKNLIEKILRIFNNTDDSQVIVKLIRSLFIIKAEGFWINHFTFEKPARENLNYFIGANRADEIIVNVLFPFLSVFSEVHGNKELSKKVFLIYGAYQQAEENSIITRVSEGLSIQHLICSSVMSQGMIELHKSYCSKSRCGECKIGKAIVT
ncbi:MAG: DUF2851 family protein [Ignavibacteria bacterium]